MNRRLLKSFMVKFGDSGDTLSQALGISRGTLSNKMTGYRNSEFTQGEMLVIKGRYHLTPDEMNEIFFAKEVS